MLFLPFLLPMMEVHTIIFNRIVFLPILILILGMSIWVPIDARRLRIGQGQFRWVDANPSTWFFDGSLVVFPLAPQGFCISTEIMSLFQNTQDSGLKLCPEQQFQTVNENIVEFCICSHYNWLQYFGIGSRH